MVPFSNVADVLYVASLLRNTTMMDHIFAFRTGDGAERIAFDSKPLPSIFETAKVHLFLSPLHPRGISPVNKTMLLPGFLENGRQGFRVEGESFGPVAGAKTRDVIHHGGITKKGSDVQYIGALLKGTMSIIDIPSTIELKTYTGEVYSIHRIRQYGWLPCLHRLRSKQEKVSR